MKYKQGKCKVCKKDCEIMHNGKCRQCTVLVSKDRDTDEKESVYDSIVLNELSREETDRIRMTYHKELMKLVERIRLSRNSKIRKVVR